MTQREAGEKGHRDFVSDDVKIVEIKPPCMCLDLRESVRAKDWERLGLKGYLSLEQQNC